MSLPEPPAASPPDCALFLDIDGTLAEFERLPSDVIATPRLTRLLTRLSARLDGRVAVISGRAMADIDRITERAVIAASGVHGLERRRTDGEVETAVVHPGIAKARAAFHALLQTQPRLVLEDKGLGLVLHYRAAPDLQALANDAAERVAAETGLALQRGDMMAEVRTPGRTKGDALTSFMVEPPFADHVPIYIGDDLTDEHAFEAARALGGYGVLVGQERTTAARYRLANVQAVLSWLDAFANAPAEAKAG